MPYSKLNNLTELIANDVKFISVNRQKLDLFKYIYTYGTVNSVFVEIQPDSTNIKNDPRNSIMLNKKSSRATIQVSVPESPTLALLFNIIWGFPLSGHPPPHPSHIFFNKIRICAY